MRLIDADELKKDDEVTMWLSNDAIRTGKQLKMFSELFINKIDNMPTVQAVPIEVLDKIRTEIEQTVSRYSISRERGCVGQVEWSDRLIKESEVLQIIDKYKAESEG